MALPPPAWTLRAGHPALCPGAGQPCCINDPYRLTHCPSCGARTSAVTALAVPGGGRVGPHYPSDAPCPHPPTGGAGTTAELEGQLTLDGIGHG